jgi:microsomal dipeptidase-like Zn-dependent dipeptidase
VVDLADAMTGVGLKAHEIRAYMGGNFLRVLRRCIG